MRKIGIVAAVVFVASWMFSLFCMHAAGQAGGTVKEENGSVVSGESVLDGYGQTEVERSVSGQTTGWDSNGRQPGQLGKQRDGMEIPAQRGSGRRWRERTPAASFWNATVSAPIFRWKIIFRALWSARPVRKWGWKR